MNREDTIPIHASTFVLMNAHKMNVYRRFGTELSEESEKLCLYVYAAKYIPHICRTSATGFSPSHSIPFLNHVKGIFNTLRKNAKRFITLFDFTWYGTFSILLRRIP